MEQQRGPGASSPTPGRPGCHNGFGPVVLASTSPRRQQMLRDQGLDVVTVSPEVEEVPEAGEAPVEYVLRNGALKARAACAKAPDTTKDRLVVASDTIVVAPDGLRILEKPADPAAAAQMLDLLSGRSHEVLSSLVIWWGSHPTEANGAGFPLSAEVVRTKVSFASFPRAWRESYIASAEPYDKAGGYGIQGRAGAWVRRLEGSYTNVVGLPLCETLERLAELGTVASSYGSIVPALDPLSDRLERLVAVSKSRPVHQLRMAYALGQRNFGESYVQELLAKKQALAPLPDVVWHFTGRLQSNKIAALAQAADIIHSLEDLEKAQALATACSRAGRTLGVYIKPELSPLTPASSGCSWETAARLAQFLCEVSVERGPLRWLGFMGMAPLGVNATETEGLFGDFMRRGAALWNETQGSGTPLSFSLGMSDDALLARRAAQHLGLPAPVVRLGRALFGDAPAPADPNDNTRSAP